ncbi:MAG: zinc/manganese transport system substrate-binding protein [Candidatus Sumerlaeota bacterium]|nr:zinc/manganese transport system substrate-binding protein [Candidatus Sumerlaeota bacterium]
MKLPFRLILPVMMLLAALAMPTALRAEAKPLRVVASTGILADIARNVGGDRVEVVSLLPPGADLHSFQPSPRDVQQLANADVVVVNGLGLEAWLDEVIRHSGYAGKVVVATNGIVPLPANPGDGHDHGHDHGDEHDHEHADDPHAWLAVANGIQYAENIRAALAEADPEGAADYAAWASLYTTQLKVLDSWIQREVARIPRERRILITDHNAFQYFGAAYGVEVVSLTGAHRLQEPSAQDVAALVSLMREKGVSHIFIEAAGNEKAMRQLAAESGAEIAGRLHTDGSTLESAMLTYIDLHRLNVRMIVRSLE